MFRKTYFRSGDWNAICDICGEKYKASQLKKRWDGLMVCLDDWEMRHPQELIRPIKERNSVPWTRPRPPDIEIGGTTPSTSGADVLYPPTFNPNTL
jgi:hypothetical protein